MKKILTPIGLVFVVLPALLVVATVKWSWREGMRRIPLLFAALVLCAAPSFADPVLHGGTANVSFYGVHNWHDWPMLCVTVENTSNLTLSEIAFSLPDIGAEALATFRFAEGEGVFSIEQSAQTFSVLFDCLPDTAFFFGVRGNWSGVDVSNSVHVYFQPVPEPTTVLLIGSGLAGLGLARLRIAHRAAGAVAYRRIADYLVRRTGR